MDFNAEEKPFKWTITTVREEEVRPYEHSNNST